MTEPIYHLYLLYGAKEAYYQLSPEAAAQFEQRNDEIHQAAGGKPVIVCNSRWCNEKYYSWGIYEYPNLQARQKAVRECEDTNQQFRYLEAESYLGTLWEGSQISKVDYPNPIYQLVMLKNQVNDPWESLPAEERERLFALDSASSKKHGAVDVVFCRSNWSNEEILGFGVQAWPDIASQQAHFIDLEKIGWHRYVYAKIILGTKLE
jgi:hypothetical protein